MMLYGGFADEPPGGGGGGGEVRPALVPAVGWGEWGVQSGVATTTRAGRRVSPWEAFVLPLLHLRRPCAAGAAGPGLVVRDRCVARRLILEPAAEPGGPGPAGEPARAWRAAGLEVEDGDGGAGVRRRLVLGRRGAEGGGRGGRVVGEGGRLCSNW